MKYDVDNGYRANTRGSVPAQVESHDNLDGRYALIHVAKGEPLVYSIAMALNSSVVRGHRVGNRPPQRVCEPCSGVPPVSVLPVAPDCRYFRLGWRAVLAICQR